MKRTTYLCFPGVLYELLYMMLLAEKNTVDR